MAISVMPFVVIGLVAIYVAIVVLSFHYYPGTPVEKMNMALDSCLMFSVSGLMIGLFWDRDAFRGRPAGPNVNIWGELIDENLDEQGIPWPAPPPMRPYPFFHRAREEQQQEEAEDADKYVGEEGKERRD